MIKLDGEDGVLMVFERGNESFLQVFGLKLSDSKNDDTQLYI